MKEKKFIYFDNAATTYHKPEEVIESVIYGLRHMGNNGRGVNEVAISTARIIYETREKVAKFFNGNDSRCVAFTSNATEALNTAIKGLCTEKDHVITTEMEHNSVLRPLYELREKGLEITFLKKEEALKLDREKMKKYLRKNTVALISTHVSNLTGDIADVENMGKFSRENGLIFILDASQSAGVIPVDIEKYNIDILCFTGHKGLLGPQGTGGLYVREGVKVNPLKSGGSGMETYNERHPENMPERLEAGTLNGHGIIGLGAGLDYISGVGIENIHKKETELMWQFYEGIKNIKDIKIYGNFFENGKRVERAPIVTLNLGDIDSGEMCDILNAEYGIVTRAGGHCAPLMHRALGTEEQGAVRFSFSYFNSSGEVESAIKALTEISEEID